MQAEVKAALKLAAGLACIFTLPVAAFVAYLAYEGSLALVREGVSQPFASADPDTLRAVADPKPSDPTLSVLKSSGRLFTLGAGTKVRVLGPCSAPTPLVRVKVLEGPRTGEVAWTLFDNIQCENAVVP